MFERCPTKQRQPELKAVRRFDKNAPGRKTNNDDWQNPPHLLGIQRSGQVNKCEQSKKVFPFLKGFLILS